MLTLVLDMGFQVNCISGTASESVEELRDLLVPDAAKWYQTASYGQLELNITADTTKFYRMPKSAASYKWEEGFSAEQHLSYIQDALDAYTNNGARPPPAETDILYIATTRNNDKMTRSLGSSFSVSARNGKLVSRRAVTFGADPYISWGYKAHTLTPVEVEGGVKAIVVAKNDTSALVVEARVAKGVDRNICAPGVLLYTVDTTLATSEGSIKVLDVTPGSNGCGDANGAVERQDFVDEWEEVV
ncbi:hypothetical protein J7337_012824 [Fusarium musae]|uniref:Uncharacterized protein n=1 Tax=Fusarium musae TaxID=1042133 RepID=A0A9P8D6M9_9HYPO|nr:hypothetical protein J7337_012824 [Fusarium musae]KAG9496241.1 hypothetical protein J7337_012824 [Fusarium musae]